MKVRKLHLVGALIMGSWVASLGWLVQREYFAQSAPGEVPLSALVAPGATFYAVFLNGVQIGVASTTIDTMLGTVRVSERLDAKLPAGRDTLDVRLGTDLQLSSALALRSFTTQLAGDLPGITLRGLMGAGDSLALEIDRAAARSVTARIPLDGATLTGAVPLRIAVAGRPRIGERHAFALLDPIDGSRRRRELVVADSARLTVVDSARFDSASGTWLPASELELTAWRLDELGGEVPRSIWIDAQGYVIEQETEFGLTYRRTAFEIAQLNLRSGRPARAPDAPLRIERGGADSAGTDPESLRPEVMIPSAAPEMVASARSTVAAAESDEAAARALLRGVAGSRGGGAQERSRAFVTLARAAGLPARMVGGARPGDGAWIPHAWAEVQIGGRWVPVDPARGRWPADTTLVRLRTGGVMHPLQLLPLVFRLPPPPAPTS